MYLFPVRMQWRALLTQLLESEVKEAVKRFCRRLQKIFPDWEIQGLTGAGSLTLEALDQAEKWKPDMIVVGRTVSLCWNVCYPAAYRGRWTSKRPALCMWRVVEP